MLDRLPYPVYARYSLARAVISVLSIASGKSKSVLACLDLLSAHTGAQDNYNANLMRKFRAIDD